MKRAWAGLAAFCLAILAAAACVSDHDALVRRDGAGRGGSGGGSDSGSDRGGAIGDAGAGEASDAEAEAGDSAADGPREPSGTDRLTLLHGVVDAPRLAFCLIRQGIGRPPEPLEPPMPPSGLDYATSLIVGTTSGIDFATEAVRFVVLAGDATALASSTCAGALALADAAPGDASVVSDAGVSDAAPQSPLRARSLPSLPASTLTNGRSFLLVATGCLGAPAHDSSARETICGTGYAPTRPTLSMVLAPMSRLTSSGRLGLQALHASRATDSVGVVSLPPPASDDPALFVASDVVYGQMAPRFANVQYGKGAYGVPLEDSQIDIRRKAAGGTLSVRWGDALARGGVTAVDEGKSYVLVFVGPQVGSRADWANAPTVTVVASDPGP
jgi:hypothetical protein